MVSAVHHSTRAVMSLWDTDASKGLHMVSAVHLYRVAEATGAGAASKGLHMVSAVHR